MATKDKKDENRFITPEEAIALLNDGEYIHTFRNPAGGMLIGADLSKQSILELINKFPLTLQIGGPQSRAMKHGLILQDENGYLFIETNKEKLDAFDPQ